jgi:flagellar motor switch protein FliM
VSEEDPKPPQGQADISEEEVDALLEKPENAAAVPGEVRDYDLVAPDQIVRGRMPTLDRINERWVSAFQQALEGRQRQPLEVQAEQVKVLRYAEWLASLPTNTTLNLMVVKPVRGSCLIATETNLLSLLVDSYFGGSPKSEELAEKEPTPVELRTNGILLELLTSHFAQAFAPIAQLSFELVRTDTNSNYVSVATPSESVMVISLNISFGEAGGRVDWMFPASLLEPFRAKLDEQLMTGAPESQAHWQQTLYARLEQTDLTLASVFLKSTLSVREVMGLKPGDVVPIEMPKTTVLYAGGQPLLHGKFGRSRGYNAIKVLQAEPLRLQAKEQQS